MINDSTNIDSARRNLMILTTVLLFLTLTKTNVNNFVLLKIPFELSNAPDGFKTFNEILFYLLTYFFIRFISISTDHKEFLEYTNSSTIGYNANKSEIIEFWNVEDKDLKKGFNTAFLIGRYLQYSFSIFNEIFLNKNFSLFIFPVLYYFTCIVYFNFTIQIHITTFYILAINIIGFLYFLMMPLVVYYIKNNEKININFRRNKKIKELKEKYNKFKSTKTNFK